jgi:hypothetical protein
LTGPIKIDRKGARAEGAGMNLDGAIQNLQIQARVCAAMGSPFSGDLLSRAAGDVAVGGPSAALFEPWAGASAEAMFEDAVALRFLGAAHDLALSGENGEVSAAWPVPGRPADGEGAWAALRVALAAEGDRFAAFMAHEPQTNEVRRSACLLPGFVTLARETGLPLRTLELGASAGLNQSWDAYRYDLGAAGAWGDADAPVHLDAEWRGPPADLSAGVAVVSRAACDRKPVDLADPLARRRLRAYVWADQYDRLARLEAAVQVALDRGVNVEAADALDFVRGRAEPQPGSVCVIYHSIFWQYLPAATQAGLARAIAEAGGRASAQAPLAWLRMEPQPPDMGEIELRLTLWPGGEERRLARCHPHGAWIEWDGEFPSG